LKIKRNTVAKLSVSGQWSRKGPFRSVGAIYYTRCSHTLTIVIDAIARGENFDRKCFLQLDDQQSVDQQAFEVVLSFSKLPGGNLM
jgi:hypothetical protein